MIEPTIWLQLGLTESQAGHVTKEIQSILKTKEKIGTMMLMVKDSTMTTDEKQYASFLIAKEDITRRLVSAVPAMVRPLIEKVMKE
jgi:hypothetical protein